MRMWNDVDALGKLSRFLPYAPIVLGFAIAFSGQFLKSVVDGRISKLETEIELAYRSTTPKVDAFLAHSQRTGKKLVVIDIKNEVPIEASWLVATKDNVVVSPIMTSSIKLIPQNPDHRFSSEITINDEKVVENYIELRFQFESMYSKELGDPEELRGKTAKSYSYVQGQIRHLGL